MRISYESRRLFAEIENAHGVERQLESDRRRLEAERQAQATHLRVERTAREKLAMRAATPANTQYVVDAGSPPRLRRADRGRAQAGGRAMKLARRSQARAVRARPRVSNVDYANSPLLASKTPPWRSRFLVVLRRHRLRRCCVGRAAYIQIVGTDFYLKQGEMRYAHTLEVPASRGRIVDRNGLLLATSVPTPSIWAIPKDVEADDDERKRARASARHERRRSSTPGSTATPTSCGSSARSTTRVGASVKRARHQGHPPGAANTGAGIPRARPRRTWSASPASRTRARKASSSPTRSSCRAATARARS